ncbi:putative mitochondrial hypothetical protein [Leptomonas pyrrhocoris]|uniref:Uncharacterized protein n=1 Tax=Leptomonas pyrrhocoris TaxID=157538 RepID=A0A0M9FSJ9_LEPPY|nr:putative mitochondrial hypothetical protein [Leptomonas pyrrhocoris]KPA75117.1 putative mitochondrial hypothetical protein [Leptomonas pyrrhocoris]|eukprot:XP_015653556.1 putative mitochondrial hypothetical protein [Leptomonas pyrrhocoris]
MPPPASAAAMNAASRMNRRVSRIDHKTAEKLFPREQRLQWPDGYLPASGVAHLLRPNGVPFQEVLECYADIKQDQQHELQRDFAADYTLWHRCALEQFVRSLGVHRRRRFTRLTARDRLVHDGDVRDVFQLPPYAPPAPMRLPGDLHRRGAADRPQQQQVPASLSSKQETGKTASSQQQWQQPPKYYEFQPYAATQEYAMLPVRSVHSPQQRVQFTTFPQLRNVLHTDFDSMSAMRALSLYSDDSIVFTRELVQTIALYLLRRLDEIAQAESSFLASASTASDVTSSLSPLGRPTFAAETPVVAFFGNGRLAWMLNESGLLPQSVRAVQLPRHAAERQRRQTHLLQRQKSLGDSFGFHSAFSAIFPCETLSVGDALRKYRPAIALVEPHVDRDYLSDLRGFFSVREVLCCGPIDSPAMGSFAFPFLSFGVTPGPTTYWAYNDNLHKVTAAARIQMPMDAPFVSQGYERCYVDDVSAYLISPNDCPALTHQYRCLAFRRVRPPVLQAVTSAQQQRVAPEPRTAPSSSSSASAVAETGFPHTPTATAA